MKTLLIAHRGDTNNFKENTLEAFESAFKLGADGIELDIQLFQNNLIVVHNYQFDKTATFPTLDEVLAKFGSLGRIEIEVKGLTYDIITSLVASISKYPELDYEITSSVFFLIPEIRRQLPKISIGLIFKPSEFETWMTKETVLTKIINITKTLNANVAHLSSSLITRELVQHLHKEGIKVHSHIGIDDTVDVYNQFYAYDVDQCTFDNIYLLSQVSK